MAKGADPDKRRYAGVKKATKESDRAPSRDYHLGGFSCNQGSTKKQVATEEICF